MQNCTAVDEALRERLGLEDTAFVAQLLPQLMELVRASRRLPIGEEHAIRRGSKEFLAASKELGQRSMSAVQRTMRWLDAENASGVDDLVNFNLVEDSIDTVLERVDSCIRDALAGLSRSSEAVADPELSAGGALESSGGGSIAKPQVRWRELIDNDRTDFIPRLMVKHNQQVPLTTAFLEAQRKAGLRAGAPGKEATSTPESASGADAENSALRTHLNALGVDNGDKATSSLSHPYKEEISRLSYTDGLFETGKPEHFGRMEDTPLVRVRTARDLRQLINEVKATCVGKEIAVDLEHHDLRSYRGFTCLVQLSTRQKDFLIDPFDIFEQMHWLNEIFTDPSILKVLHGADRDVQWLQRDFSVYLVNMFDTGLATRALRLQGGFSLANLVSHYCGVKLDKKYQTADWRQRPLSEEMAHYARCDTHYLLYCFDCLRNALLANRPIKVGDIPDATAEGIQTMRGVLDSSARLCQTMYTESPLDEGGIAMRLCARFGSKKPLESKQFSCLKALAAWRDKLGRSLDESTNFVAPDACLWRVALALPTSGARLRSTCNPLPQLLQQHSAEVVEVVVNSAEATATNEDPRSPIFTAVRTQSAPALGADAGPAQLPPPACGLATSSAAKATPRQDWPPSSSRAASPIVRVSSGSLRHASNGDTLRRSSSLTSLFESESSADDDMDIEAATQMVKNLAPVFSRAAMVPQARPSFPPKPPPVVSAQAPMLDATEKIKEEGEAALAHPQSLQEAYQLPSAVRRNKKKKKKKAAVPQSLGAAVAPAPAPASSAVGSLEAEAASFRATLSAAFSQVPPAAGAAAEAPRPTKRKATVEPAADPYAASTVASDPYAATAPVGDPFMAAAPVLKKKKKLKKKITPGQAPPAAAADPYL